VEALAEGRDFLNAFSYSGGFSLYAARGGASTVTDLDISGHALESAKRNFALNPDLASVRHETVQADAFDWLKGSPAGQFGLVVLDPPSLAPREANRGGSARRECLPGSRRDPHPEARRDPGRGLLLIPRHSGSFFRYGAGGYPPFRRNWREKWTSEHAPDHPATFPEAHYLKAICLELDER